MNPHRHLAASALLSPLLLLALLLAPRAATAEQVNTSETPQRACEALTPCPTDEAQEYMDAMSETPTAECGDDGREPCHAAFAPLSPLVPIDADVVLEVLRERLDDVAREALADALEHIIVAGRDGVAVPLWLTDIIETIGVLVVRDQAEEFESERLGLAVARLAAVAALSEAFCDAPTTLDCVDVVYAGARQSLIGAHLAFSGAERAQENDGSAEGVITATLVEGWINDIVLLRGLAEAGTALELVQTECGITSACEHTDSGVPLHCFPDRVAVELQQWPSSPSYGDVRRLVSVARDWRAGLWASEPGVTGRPSSGCATALEAFGETADATAWSLDEQTNTPFSVLYRRAVAADTMLQRRANALAPLVAVVRPLVTGDDAAARDAWLPFVTAGAQRLIDALNARISGCDRRCKNRPARRVAEALSLVAQQLPSSLRLTEASTLGIELDVDALTIELLESVRTASDGFGFRASIGFGYVSVTSIGGGDPDDPDSLDFDFSKHTLMAVPYDEIGIMGRWRVNHSPLRLGVHVAVSGALMQLVDTGDLRNPVLVGLGTHATIYDAIDVSVTTGVMRTGIVGRLARRTGSYLAFGVQLPLVEYVRRL